MALTGKIGIDLQLKYTKTADLAVPLQDLIMSPAWKIASGVIADAGDLLFADQRTITAGNDDDLDLAGSLLDAMGSAFTPAKLKAIVVEVVSGGTLTFKRHATAGVPVFAAANDALAGFAAGDLIVLTHRALAGWAVTGTTADLLSFAAVTADVVYRVVLVGTSS